jgi:hypothetical protein
MMVVFSLSTFTVLAVPSWVIAVFSSLRPSSSVMTSFGAQRLALIGAQTIAPMVRMATSSSMGFDQEGEHQLPMLPT